MWPGLFSNSIDWSTYSPCFKGRYTRGILLPEQSSSVCTNDFMGILHPREQNFNLAKCSTICNQLNIWEQTPGANWANLKTLPRVYWHVQNEPGACSGSKTLVCIGLNALGIQWVSAINGLNLHWTYRVQFSNWNNVFITVWPRGVDSHMKQTEMLVENFEFNP